MAHILKIKDEKIGKWVNIPAIKGENGKDGTDGVSATHSWDGTTLTVTSASGTSSADLKGEKGDKGDYAMAVGTYAVPVASWLELAGDAIYNFYADATIAVSPALGDDSIVQFVMDNLMDNNNVGVFSSEGTDTLTVRFYAVSKPVAEVTGRVICFNPSGV